MSDSLIIVQDEQPAILVYGEGPDIVIVEGPGPRGPRGADGEGVAYDNPDPTTITVGGIPAGTIFDPAVGINEILDRLFYPYQHPAFTAFGLSGVASPFEVGASFGPNVTFTWSTSQGGNVAPNSVSIGDATLGTTLASGLANDGSQAITLGAAVTRASAGTHAFNIGATDTESTTFTDSLTIAWQWRRYFGTSVSTTLTASQILALVSGGLATGYAGSFAFAGGGYKFICLADAAGGQINAVKDAATQLSVPMAGGTHTDGGGFGYELVSVTNAQGVTANVRVYRTTNILGSAITLVVS